MDSDLKRSAGPAKTLRGTGWDLVMTLRGRQRFQGGVCPVLAALREAQATVGLAQAATDWGRTPMNWHGHRQTGAGTDGLVQADLRLADRNP